MGVVVGSLCGKLIKWQVGNLNTYVQLISVVQVFQFRACSNHPKMKQLNHGTIVDIPQWVPCLVFVLSCGIFVVVVYF